MPKSRDPSRSKPVRHEPPAGRPPDKEDVERAIEGVLDRLRPKTRRPPKTRPERPVGSTRSAAYLSVVPDTGGDRG